MVLWLLFLFAQATVPEKALPPHMNYQTVSEPSKVRLLLQSSDSREQAWGAWLAGQGQIREAIPALQQIVTMRLIGSNWMEDGLPLDAALDALIQLQAKIPPSLISAVYQKRAAQALVLLSMHDHDGDSLLLELAAREKGLKWFCVANLLLLIAHKDLLLSC